MQATEKPRLKKGADMAALDVATDAFLAVENGLIVAWGPMSDWEGISDWRDLTVIDCTDRYVLPAWCDSHTHLVFAGSRENEFTDRLRGLTYEEIAARGGGILSSSRKMRAAGEEELLQAAEKRIRELISTGTGAVEIKSGYGLDMESELKMLRVIKKLRGTTPVLIRSTFLGAHAFPAEYKNDRRGYIRLLTDEMIPAIAAEKLADFCDVFCERNYFTPGETIEILEAGKKHGLQPKVHANQLSLSGGIEAGVTVGAVSVDHLEYVEEEQIRLLQGSSVIPTILPGAQFFLDLPRPPARKMIDSGLPLAVASDFNPGSSPGSNMFFMHSLAAVLYKLTPSELINASTINTAYAMGCERELGSITTGKIANLMITREIPSLDFIPYSIGSNPLETVILNGKIEWQNNL